MEVVFGSNKEDGMVENVLVADELSTLTLAQLCKRDISVIHVKSFYPADIARAVAKKAIDHPKLGHYHKQYTSSVGRICVPHIDTESDEALAEKYYREADDNISDIRSLFFPYISPADYVRLRLQELWPAGANIQQIRGRSCFVGAIRVFQPKKSQFFPHNDRIDHESDAAEVRDLGEQLVANMYLEVPSRGGDLLLWLREPTAAEHETIREVEGLASTDIGPPRVVIHPDPGDLIIFSSRMLHAVTSCEDGYRVGMATFIGCRSPDKPLTYWS
jgi:hypothetical protein